MSAIQRIIDHIDSIDGMPFGRVEATLDKIAIEAQLAATERDQLIDLIDRIIDQHGGMCASPLAREALDVVSRARPLPSDAGVL